MKLKSKLLTFFYFLFLLNISIDIKSNNDNDDIISFQFNGKTLGDLLHALADIKKINILLPSEILKENSLTINFSTPNDLPITEIEEYLLYFLSMAGYILTLRDNIFIVVKKNDDIIRRVSLPLFVNVPPEELPNNSGYIKAIYFLKHLKVPGGNNIGSEAIKNILFDIIPDREKACMVDPRSNAIIMIAPSNSIACAMTIILELDNYGIRDEVAIVPLEYTSVGTISRVLEELLSVSKEGNSINPNNNASYSGGAYFSPQTKIVQNVRNNSLIIMGKKNAIEKLITFIKSELDIPQESGKSVIHVYNLQYLNAKKIAPILQNLVNGKQQSSGGQSIRETGTIESYRLFDNVRILAEETPVAQSDEAGGNSAQQSGLLLGGNRLIIAANADDYEIINELIRSIDKPQPQIILEAMFLDLEVDESGNFGTQLRVPSIFNLPPGVQFQSIMMDSSQVMINDPLSGNTAITSPSGLTQDSTLGADLLSGIQSGTGDSGSPLNDGGGNSLGESKSIVDLVKRGGVIVSLGEEFMNSSISSILNLSESIRKKNVLANPYSITNNNQQTVMQSVQLRRAEGDLGPTTQYSGATVVKIENYEAALGISITPRINFGSIEEGKKPQLNLEINIEVEEFLSSESSDVNKLIRNIKTSANVISGDLLILGGLYKQSYNKVISKTPILGDIPLIGGFFRGTSRQKSTTKLLMLIRATIVEGDFMQEFTQRKKDEAYIDRKDLALGSLNDSITHFYIDKNNKSITVIDTKKNTSENIDLNIKDIEAEMKKDIFYVPDENPFIVKKDFKNDENHLLDKKKNTIKSVSSLFND